MDKGLKLIVPDNFREFGNKVNEHLKGINDSQDSYITPINLVRFNNGEGKCILEESVRDLDVYILTDIGNYDVTYKIQRGIHHMMPDEHFQDIKRIISSMDGHAKKITLVMPLLYQSRQDKRTARESLDCAMGLQELERFSVKELVTFDAHNPMVSNAIPNKMTFSNGYATSDLVIQLLMNEDVSLSNLFIVSPDEGARTKAKFLADILGGIKYGNFDKRRDYTKVEDGMNPIVYHEFVGPDRLDGLDVIIVDDMIASGGSLLDAARQVKDRGARNVFLMTTFALFTEGIDKFQEAYEEKVFQRLYSTNLTYVPIDYRSNEWFFSVDCSLRVANIISSLHKGESIRNLLNGKEETAKRVKVLKKY